MSDERFAEILNELQARGDKSKLMQLVLDALTILFPPKRGSKVASLKDWLVTMNTYPRCAASIKRAQ
jgi:hypothetical protein